MTSIVVVFKLGEIIVFIPTLVKSVTSIVVDFKLGEIIVFIPIYEL